MTNLLYWALGILLYGVIDTILTVFGRVHGIHEANPVAVAALEVAGVPGFVVLKVAAIAAVAALATFLDRRSRTAAPILMSVIGLVAVAVNLVAIAENVYQVRYPIIWGIIIVFPFGFGVTAIAVAEFIRVD